jgi:sec-independent protein translocase protein TatA
MGGLSVWHWLIFLAVALLLFGGSGKISSIMGDVAKGIKSFKKGMAEDDETAKKDDPAKKDEPPKVIESAAAKPQGAPAGVEAGKAGWGTKA